MSWERQAMDAGVAASGGLLRAGVIARELDLRGLPKPLPVAIAAQVLREMPRGEMLKVLTNVEGALDDFAALAAARPAIDLVAQGECTQGHVHVLRRRLRLT